MPCPFKIDEGKKRPLVFLKEEMLQQTFFTPLSSAIEYTRKEKFLRKPSSLNAKSPDSP